MNHASLISREALEAVLKVNASAPSLIEFGNAAKGDLSEFADSSGANYGPSTGSTTVLKDAGPNGGNVIRMITDDNSRLYGDNANVRIHIFGFPGGNPPWFGNDQESWQGISLRFPSGAAFQSLRECVTCEVHGVNGSGPAPTNYCGTRGGNYREIVRGSTFGTPNPPGGFPFEQNTFGLPHTVQYDGTYYRRNFDWVGGDKPVVLDQWLHRRVGWERSLDPGKGWILGYYRWDGLDDWVEAIPKKINIRTSYSALGGSGSPIYPMLSVYYPVGGGSKQCVDYAAGAWASSFDELAAWQDARLGFAGSPTPPPPTPDVAAAIAHLKSGLAEFEQTDAWKLYHAKPTTNTFKAHADFEAAKSALGG